MNSPSRRFDLDVSIADVDFRSATQEQIVKDFAKFDLYFPDGFKTTVFSIEEIEYLVGQHVVALIEKGERHLLQLLYTIDIPEKKFLNMLSQVDFLNVLTHQIVLREAYKVWLRANFSS